MARLSHKEFIEKMARYKPIYTARQFPGEPYPSYTNLGKPFGLSPTSAWQAVNFYTRHALDPQQPVLGEEDHDCVCELGKLFDLSSQASIRAGLCAKFKAEPSDGKMNHKHDVRKSLLVKVMKASGLKWFELDGTPMIHWCEKV